MPAGPSGGEDGGKGTPVRVGESGYAQDMSIEIIIAGLATLVAAAALFFTARAANAAKHQTKLQREMRQASAEPYIWVDMRPDDAQGGLLVLMVGNSGPTVATNVRVIFSPSLDMVGSSSRAEHAIAALRKGLPSLAPSRVWTWSLGMAHEAVAEERELTFEVAIDADGPFGPLSRLSYSIGLQEIRHTLVAPAGSLHTVSTAVGKLNDTLKKIDGKLDREDE